MFNTAKIISLRDKITSLASQHNFVDAEGKIDIKIYHEDPRDSKEEPYHQNFLKFLINLDGNKGVDISQIASFRQEVASILELEENTVQIITQKGIIENLERQSKKQRGYIKEITDRQILKFKEETFKIAISIGELTSESLEDQWESRKNELHKNQQECSNKKQKVEEQDSSSTPQQNPFLPNATPVTNTISLSLEEYRYLQQTKAFSEEILQDKTLSHADQEIIKRIYKNIVTSDRQVEIK
jgi:hypothetical protein